MLIIGDNMRNKIIEKTLQKALESGNDIWVIGDVHGFNETLRSLVKKLDLQTNDYVVLLGDLIDRGPNSYDVVQYVKSMKNVVSIKGNHEEMMSNSLSLERLELPDIDLATWLHCGGLATVTSYINAYTDENGKEFTTQLDEIIEHDTRWMDQLPSQIILNDWRLVHGGYDPEIGLDDHTDSELLHIRKPFHIATKPIDGKRTVMFGHTPTVSLPGHSKQSWGHVWYSNVLLKDGRPAAIGLDTCVFHNADGPAVLTAYNLKDGSTIQQDRVEKWNRKAIIRANNV